MDITYTYTHTHTHTHTQVVGANKEGELKVGQQVIDFIMSVKLAFVAFGL